MPSEEVIPSRQSRSPLFPPLHHSFDPYLHLPSGVRSGPQFRRTPLRPFRSFWMESQIVIRIAALLCDSRLDDLYH